MPRPPSDDQSEWGIPDDAVPDLSQRYPRSPVYNPEEDHRVYNPGWYNDPEAIFTPDQLQDIWNWNRDQLSQDPNLARFGDEFPFWERLPSNPVRPTIPKPLPGKTIRYVPAEHFSNTPDWFDPYKDRAPGMNKLSSAFVDALDSKMKAQKFARGAPWALGFQIGWEIGDYLFPNGFYDFGSGVGVPDESAGPEGWVNPKWNWYPCAVQCTYGAERWYDADFPLTCPVNCNSGFVVPGAYADPATAHANQVSHPIDVFVSAKMTAGPATGFYKLVGQLQMWDYPNDGEWTVQYVPGTGTPATAPLAKPMPSEAPETFPMEWPMHPPYPQRWADAIPKPKTQGEGKHRPRRQTVPGLPLAPYPVVVVVPPPVPPGETVPPPPDQVITVPPPGGGPPTYHTQPSSGRTPPKGRTKEKKLSVRTAANKAWITLNLATEAFDLIDALFDALPKECRDKATPTIDYGRKGGGKADPYSKAKAVYDCFEGIDWSKFVNNFINQQVTDMTVGLIGMMSQRYLKMTGQPTGSGGLVSKPSQTAQKALEKELDEKVERGEITKEEKKAILEGAKLPIPKVTYNEGEGHWEVSISQWGLTFH